MVYEGPKPFREDNKSIRINLTNPYNIRNFARLIEYFNRIGYIPAA
jgi:hypothetical protein